jgi:plasmid stabilization system protein ParE
VSYKLLLLPRAERDVNTILEYLVSRSVQGATDWELALQAALNSAKRDPLRFAIAPESQDHSREIRQVLFKTRRGRFYRFLYTVVDATVYVLHVRGPNQRPLQEGELGTTES